MLCHHKEYHQKYSVKLYKAFLLVYLKILMFFFSEMKKLQGKPLWNARQCISSPKREERKNHLACFLSARTDEWKQILGSFASFLFCLWFFSLFSATKWITIQYQYKHHFDNMRVFTIFVYLVCPFSKPFAYIYGICF